MVFFRALAAAMERVYAACAVAAAALMAGLCLLVLGGMAARMFGAYSGGAADVAGYVLASATFLSLAPAFRSRGHICVSVLTSRLPAETQKQLSVLAHAFMILASACLAFYISRLAFFSWQFGERSQGADGLLLWKPQLAAATGAWIFAAAALHGGAEALRSAIDSEDGAAPPSPDTAGAARSDSAKRP